MPIQYVRGDLFASGADILTIPVNCVGVAGKGLALQCKQRYPEWFRTYQYAGRFAYLSPGYPVLHHFPMFPEYPHFLNFPTKCHWRFPSRFEWIVRGLYMLVHTPVVPWSSIDTIAFPMLGCGAGGLSWSDVQPVMDHYLSQLPCTVLIYVS